MKEILILSGSHLCHNPRVIKEACALENAGFKVQVLGGWFDSELKARDEELVKKLRINFQPVHDLTKEPLRRSWLRMCGRMAKEIHRRTGLESHWQLGYFGTALRKALRRSKTDFVIAHSEQALWAISHLRSPISDFRSSRQLIGADMEDWFSEDLPPETRKNRPTGLIRSIERKALREGQYATCTSLAMSKALSNEYCCRPPTVIYNAFPWKDRANLDGQFNDRRNRSIPSIHWYSQTIGADRGLGDLFGALPFLKHDAEIHLRGKPTIGFEDWLALKVPEKWRKRVFVHPLVSNKELLSRIAEHDIGFAGEMRISRNRDLTITNKILHYLLGGLAVVASDTVGQSEVAARADSAVRLYQSENVESLALTLNDFLSVAQNLQMAKSAALDAARTRFCWEKQEPLLVQSISNALSSAK